MNEEEEDELVEAVWRFSTAHGRLRHYRAELEELTERKRIASEAVDTAMREFREAQAVLLAVAQKRGVG
jgi:hypothetical protein